MLKPESVQKNMTKYQLTRKELFLWWILLFKWPQSKNKRTKESEKIDKYLDPASELKKKKDKGHGDTSSSWCTWNNLQKLGKETGGIGSLRKNQDHQYQSSIIIS